MDAVAAAVLFKVNHRTEVENMRSNPEESAEDPEKLSIRECYKRIYDWHKGCGKTKIKERGLSDAYEKAYLAFVDAIPPMHEATQGDMDFVFGEVLGMLMEWACSEKDEHKITMWAYAKSAFDRQYTGVSDERFHESRKTSKLFPEFAFLRWKEKYEKDPKLVKKPYWDNESEEQ